MADGSKAKATVRRRARRAHERAVADTVRTLRREANRDTGAMAASVTATATTGVDRLTAKVSVPERGNPKQSDKARWTDVGTRPHVIRPKRAKVLRFPSGGRIVFAVKVNHPGYRGSRWWTTNVRRWGETVRRSWRGSR